MKGGCRCSIVSWDRFGELSPGKCRKRYWHRALTGMHFFSLAFPVCTGFRWGNFKGARLL